MLCDKYRMTTCIEKKTGKELTRIHRTLKTTDDVEYNVVQFRYVWRIMDEFVKKYPAYWTTFDVMDGAEEHVREYGVSINEALCLSIHSIDEVLTEHFGKRE